MLYAGYMDKDTYLGRAGRFKRLFLFVAIISVMLVLIVFFWRAVNTEFSKSKLSAGIAQGREDRFIVQTYTVQEGDTWSAVAGLNGIGDMEALGILDQIGPIYDLAAIKAGNEFHFFTDKEGILQKIEYDIDDVNFLRAQKTDNGTFTGKIKAIQYKINERTAQGIITSSLFETASEQGIPAGVILNLAFIFSWDIDFASSIQAGDSFSLVYEERFRGAEPAGPGNILAARFINSGNTYYSFRYVDVSGHASYYDETGKELQRQFLRSPLDYKRITSGFSLNRFHPILQTFTTHQAIDYAASAGTPVSATAHGRVVYAGWKAGYGNYLRLAHANGYNTAYAHLSAFAKGMKVGAKVSQNDIIAFVGSTGLSTGPHLHYEMIKDGVKINPLSLNLPKGDMMNGEYLPDFYVIRDQLKERLLQ